ncbi:MAG: type II secretion system protein GspE, partial [Achromobacter sp.]|nr:type II secretion system protein GspE [Achromobacter sp.]
MTEPFPLDATAAAQPSPEPVVRWPDYGATLVRAGKLTPRDLERALAAQREMGGALDAVLVSLGLVSEADAAQALAAHLELPFIAAEGFPAVLPEAAGLRPEFLKTHHVLPLSADGGVLQVAMRAPQDAFVLKALRLTTGLEPRPVVSLGSEIDKALHRYLDDAAEAEDDGAAAGPEGDAGDFVEHLR